MIYRKQMDDAPVRDFILTFTKSTGMFWYFYKKHLRKTIAIQKCPAMEVLT